MVVKKGKTPPPLDHLGDVLIAWAGANRQRSDIAEVVVGLASGARNLAAILARGALAGDISAATGATNSDGDVQKTVDVVANDIFIAALKHTPTAFLASEESNAPIALREGAALAVAIDPLDGSGNVSVNLTVGDFFDFARCANGGGFFPSSVRRSTCRRLLPFREQHASGADGWRGRRSLRARS